MDQTRICLAVVLVLAVLALALVPALALAVSVPHAALASIHPNVWGCGGVPLPC